MRQVILTADDFGLSEAVNEGIERAHRDGLLTSASLMVAGAAAEDAIRRARRLPGLRVGLHLVVIEGPSVLGHTAIPYLVGADGLFPSDQLGLGIRYFFSSSGRRQLAAEIAAQFDAFAATGLPLDHADSHKHMHLHPTVGVLLLRIGRQHGLRAVRVPAEPPAIMAQLGAPGGAMLHRWTGLFRRQAIHAGMIVPDNVFGLAWSGHMTQGRLLRLVPRLPDGISEIYFHPAAGRDATIDATMPDYEHEAELAALVSSELREAFAGIARLGYGDLR